jgi:hypothetical protein
MSPKQKQHSHHKKQRQKKRKKIFRKWHRRMGFAASLFLFNLAITGIVLNHYESLNLHKKHIQSELILDWYNIQAPSNIHCLNTNKSMICQIGDLIFYNPSTNSTTANSDKQANSDNQALPSLLHRIQGKMVNLFNIEQSYYLITSQAVMILDAELQLIDNLDLLDEFKFTVIAAARQAQVETQSQAQEAQTQKVNNYLILQGKDQSLRFNIDDESFSELNTDSAVAKTELLPPLSPLISSKQRSLLEQAYKQRQISWLKLVQDLHSGQLFSTSGKLLTDLVGVIILLLAISGFITWQRRKNQHKDYQQ